MDLNWFQKLKTVLAARLLILQKKLQSGLRWLIPALKGKGHAFAVRARELCRPENLKKKLSWQTVKVNAIPLCLVAVMLVLLSGTMQSLAWYTDYEFQRNAFTVGDMDLKVYYKNDVVKEYREMTENSKVFNEQALYEPGYTQTVYFRIENAGDVPFQYKIKVREADSKESVSVLGNEIHLADYLDFGIVTADSEPSLTREMTRIQRDGNVEKDIHEVGEYSEFQEKVIEPGKEHYAALFVYMPEKVGNEANYAAGNDAPQVILGIEVYAQQAGTMDP